MNALILVLVTVFVTNYASAEILNPIILIPGIGGSQIEGRLDEKLVQPYCYVGHTNYFALWANMSDAFYRADCFLDDIRLHYDKKSRTTRNSPGVQTRIPSFGSCDAIGWIDCNKYNLTRYFIDTIIHLTSFGYEADKSIRAAPYDFRKGPTEHEDFFVNFKNLIEDTYRTNGNKQVILMPHSMGGIMTVAFLRRQSQEWKDKHIKSMISLAGAYGGAVKAVHVIMDGYEMDLGNMFLSIKGRHVGKFVAFNSLFSYFDLLQLQVLEADDNRIRQLFRSFPGVVWLFPSPKAWNKTDVLIQTESKNYTLLNINEYFRDINFETGWEMYQDAYPAMTDLGHPGVPVHCLYGTSVPTTEQVKCTGKGLSNCNKIVQGDGDGTVNLRSLEICKQWEGGSNEPDVKNVPFKGVSHMGILKDKNVLKYVADVVTSV